MMASRSDDEMRRNLRWLSFAKPKVMFGFEHLSPAFIPTMATKARGLSIAFEGVIGWSPPQLLLKELSEGDFELHVQLSFSLFHMTSKSFFGSTWMGAAIQLAGDRRDNFPDFLEFDYSELVYMITRINDPSCVGIVEVVASKVDSHRNITVAQYG